MFALIVTSQIRALTNNDGEKYDVPLSACVLYCVNALLPDPGRDITNPSRLGSEFDAFVIGRFGPPDAVLKLAGALPPELPMLSG
jgi:hypothetical protein